MPTIDVFCHIFPLPFVQAVERLASGPLPMYQRACQIPAMIELETRFSIMDQFEDYQQLPSLASPTIEALCGPNQAAELAQIGNDSLADLVERFPERFPGFVASLPMNNIDAAHDEIDRSVDQLKAAGIQLYTNVAGVPLDTPEHLGIIAHVAEKGVPIWLHPIRPMAFADYANESQSKFDIWWAFGWPYETSTAMLRLVCAGIFDKWPELVVITHHAGGLTPLMEGRIEFGIELDKLRNPNDRALVHTDLAPIVGMRKFWADTASFGSSIPLNAAKDFFGVDKLLFASDMPFDPEGGPGFIREGLRLISQMQLTTHERKSVLEGNIRKLLKKQS